MSEELLTRLVDTLGYIDCHLAKISESLSRMSQDLSGCIADGQEGSRLCVTGDVTTFNVN